MIGVASGMANQGMIPFVYTIGIFLSVRALEFIRNDVCLQNMNVKIVGTGSGMAYSDLGSTHHATEDIGGMRSYPNLTIITPSSPLEVRKAVAASYEMDGPVYMRLGTNREPELYREEYEFKIGKAVTMKEGNDLTIIGMGRILGDVLLVAERLEKRGIHVRVVNMHTIRPIDTDAIVRAIEETGRIMSVEDHNVTGGLGSAVSEIIAEHGKGVRFRRLGLNGFSHGYGSYKQMKEMNGIDEDSIFKCALEVLGE